MVTFHINLRGITKCSSMVAYIFLAGTPPPTLRMGSMGQKSTFSEQSHVAYQIKEYHECSNMVANILPADILTLRMGSIAQNSIFSEHGHVTYQIKENHKCSNMVVKICQKIPLSLGIGFVGQIQLLQKIVTLHIKLKRTTNAPTW